MIKVLKITIQHSPIKGDPNEWVMDIVEMDGNGGSRKKSWCGTTLESVVESIPNIFKRLHDEFDWNDRACGRPVNPT